jgi:hypothetical protein
VYVGIVTIDYQVFNKCSTILVIVVLYQFGKYFNLFVGIDNKYRMVNNTTIYFRSGSVRQTITTTSLNPVEIPKEFFTVRKQLCYIIFCLAVQTYLLSTYICGKQMRPSSMHFSQRVTSCGLFSSTILSPNSRWSNTCC